MALTANDLAKILNGVQKMIDLAVSELRTELKNEIRLLPTKEEFFSRMDETTGELKDARKIKTIHPQNRHSVAQA